MISIIFQFDSYEKINFVLIVREGRRTIIFTVV